MLALSIYLGLNSRNFHFMPEMNSRNKMQFRSHFMAGIRIPDLTFPIGTANFARFGAKSKNLRGFEENFEDLHEISL